MLSTLPTVKARLEIPAVDITHDDLLTSFIAAVSAAFDKKCNRTFGRAEVTQEFPADQTEIILTSYPYQSITVFSLKSTEAEGWLDQPEPEFLVRNSCVISLPTPLGTSRQQARLVYTGGYVVPGDTISPGMTPLPDDLQQAAIEQVASWFQNRDKLGLEVHWPKGGVYQRLSQLPLLPQVESVLQPYRRWSL